VRIESLVHGDDVLTVALVEPLIPELRLKGGCQGGGHWRCFDAAVSGDDVAELPGACSLFRHHVLVGPRAILTEANLVDGVVAPTA
jgi:hypothetical protein